MEIQITKPFQGLRKTSNRRFSTIFQNTWDFSIFNFSAFFTSEMQQYTNVLWIIYSFLDLLWGGRNRTNYILDGRCLK